MDQQELGQLSGGLDVRQSPRLLLRRPKPWSLVWLPHWRLFNPLAMDRGRLENGRVLKMLLRTHRSMRSELEGVARLTIVRNRAILFMWMTGALGFLELVVFPWFPPLIFESPLVSEDLELKPNPLGLSTPELLLLFYVAYLAVVASRVLVRKSQVDIRCVS